MCAKEEFKNENEKGNPEMESEQFQPIVFVNNPIKSVGDDVIGFESQVDIIKCAIKNGATMIGIIADYGTGKSSMTELLSQSVKTSLQYEDPIEINMWDCLSNKEKSGKSNENVSNLTKSFLYQLSYGRDTKFGRFINKLLSKNYGTISFGVNSNVFWLWFVGAAISYVCYKICLSSNTGVVAHLAGWIQKCVPFLKVCAPMFVLVSVLFLLIGLKDTYVAFSHWKMQHLRELEVNDVFDTYATIINKFKSRKKKKQLVFIEDLDRVNDKGVIVDFLKELYRFQEALGSERSRFVFIISIKPECELKSKRLNKDDVSSGIDNDVEEERIYPKIFDAIIPLKPIHFDDYDSILIGLLQNNKQQLANLETLIGCKINNVLPNSFRWIKQGENLTLRDIKERLNQAISIMMSLKNKAYKVRSVANFESCAAVAYLENQFPKDYYSLIKNETAFAHFIQESTEIINDNASAQNMSETLKLIRQKFEEIFSKKIFNEKFSETMCELVLEEIFNDDFRMYFYTYPKGSHIKTTEERQLYDYIIYPNRNQHPKDLDKLVEYVFKDGQNEIICQTIKNLDKYPAVLIENDQLFQCAYEISSQKIFDIFLKEIIESNYAEDYKARFWKRIGLLEESERNHFVSKSVEMIVTLAEGSLDMVSTRRAIILGCEEYILEFSELFNSNAIEDSQITSGEIELINNNEIAIQLIDIDNIEQDHFDYMGKVLCSDKITSDRVLVKATKIMEKFSDILSPTAIGHELFSFMDKNEYLSDSFLEIISQSEIENKQIAEYLNQFDVEILPEGYFDIINAMGFDDYISRELIDALLEKRYYYTPLLYLAKKDLLTDMQGYFNSEEDILKVCEKISDFYPDAFFKIRNFCFNECNLQQYKQLYFKPYPIMSELEFVSIKETACAIKLIDASQIDEENYCDILNMIYRRVYRPEEVVGLFEWLFDSEINEDSINDESVRPLVIDAIDYNQLSLKGLDEEKRNRIYFILEEDWKIENVRKAIDVLEKVGCLIPEVEKIIHKQNNIGYEYCNLIAKLDEFTSATIEWMDSYYITVALSEKLCEQLYNVGDYQNFIIADILRKQNMVIDTDISFENYMKVYYHVKAVFSIMSQHANFLERLQLEGDLEKLSEEHLVPVFRVNQHRRFFEFIFSDKFDKEFTIKYLWEFGKFATENDSKAFQQLICQKENMELLGDENLYRRIHHQLWESNPAHKGVFTRKWNERWKTELMDAIAN